MQVWTVANQKGGVGKTTTSVALGSLAAGGGSRVLLLDLDPHGSMSCYFRQNPDTVTRSCFNLFRDRQALDPAVVSRQVIETAYDNLHLLPASTALATLERKAIGPDGAGLVVAGALAHIADMYDLVIIDTPPLLGVLMINALAACQRLVIPVQTEFLALKGLERMVHTLEMMSRSRRGGIDYTIVPTLFDRRTQASVGSLRSIRNTYGERVWPGRIPIDTKFRDASKAGVPPHILAPQSRGVRAYQSLRKWLSQAPRDLSPACGVGGGA
ncbi:ParA family protein [Exilibacterium tricleocarpae]|uniref:ParA family protein n=1 Tax=Exilibacterium tricleocarpae TaxID=2591008 RepID=A0A545U421_9GAMM|nr:ParA family protein [Exilibacterium tricleocarpae]TQV84196.1 ParA family protein [Exilibacterium tricleocarpae]